MFQRLGERHEGFVAEYCIICHDVARHAILAEHGPSGVTTVGSCTQCGLRTITDATRYLSLVKATDTPIPVLVSETHPLLPAAAVDRAYGDYMLFAGAEPAECRSFALREPFRVISYLTATQSPHFRLPIVGLIVGAILGVLLYVWADHSRSWVESHFGTKVPPIQAAAFILAEVLATGGFTYIGYRVRRRLKRRIITMIARSLRPLKPSIAELEQVLSVARVSGSAPGWLKAADLDTAIRSMPDPSFRNMTFEELRQQAAAYFDGQRALAERFEQGQLGFDGDAKALAS